MRVHYFIPGKLTLTYMGLLLSFILVGLSPASATLIGVSGGSGEIIIAPLDMSDDTPGATNDHQQGFDERQGVLLLSDLTVDGGIISAGTKVDSHMIFLNTEGTIIVSDTNRWEFATDIIGLMGSTDHFGTNIIASSPILGNFGTIYPVGAFPYYGLEGRDSFSVSGNMLDLTMRVYEPGDWIRVVTLGDNSGTAPVPEPSSMILLSIGIVGIASTIARKKLKKHLKKNT